MDEELIEWYKYVESDENWMKLCMNALNETYRYSGNLPVSNDLRFQLQKQAKFNSLHLTPLTKISLLNSSLINVIEELVNENLTPCLMVSDLGVANNESYDLIEKELFIHSVIPNICDRTFIRDEYGEDNLVRKIVISKNVPIKKDKLFKSDIVICVAPIIPINATQEDIDGYKDYITKYLEASYITPSIHKSTALVIYDWGCSEKYGNDCRFIASIFKQLNSIYSSLYRKVVYVISDKKDYEIFNSVLKI